MRKRTFYVRAVWDDKAKVFYSKSDIDGFHIEAATLKQFERAMNDLAPQLILANHISKADLMSTPIQDWMPAILWQHPEDKLAVA